MPKEKLIARWVENAYWQAFCGEICFPHEPPIHPTSLTRHRKCLGQDGSEEQLTLTIETDVAERVIEKRGMAELLIDTTVILLMACNRRRVINSNSLLSASKRVLQDRLMSCVACLQLLKV